MSPFSFLPVTLAKRESKKKERTKRKQATPIKECTGFDNKTSAMKGTASEAETACS